jgi:exopolysaccharide biosynthesis polyprenyl glycosylphosphotransferase
VKEGSIVKEKALPLVLPEAHRVPAWVMPAVKAAIILMDALLATGSFIAAFKLRGGDPVFSASAWAWSREFVPYAGILIFLVPVRIAMLLYQRSYRMHGAFSYTVEAIKIFKAVSISSLLAVAWAFLFRGGFAFREFSYSRAIFLFDFLFALLAITLLHLFLRYVQTWFRSNDINLIPTLVIGANAEAGNAVKELRERTDLGYRVVGILVNDDPYPETEIGARVLGTVRDLPHIVRSLGIQEVIITDDALDKEKLFESMMQIGRRQRVEFRFAPTLFNMLPQKTSVEQIGVLPMVRLFREPLSDVDRFLKRVFDMTVSSIILLLVSPIWAVVSVLIKWDSPGPILFRQERVGMDGRIFLCYKFRTMAADSDENVHREAYRKNIEGREEANSGDVQRPVFGKVKDDDRITRVGRILRRSSLDEIPQLLNVLRGDMSMVGPRPPIPYEVHDYDVRHRKRLDMKPGITGLWQVSGRNRLTFEEMVNIDVYYIENWSFWQDLKIIFLTLPAVFRGDGAR